MYLSRPVTAAHVRRTFEALLNSLRLPPPIVASASVALAFGAESVDIQGFEFPRIEAAFALIFVLVVLYAICGRTAYVTYCALAKLCGTNDPEYENIKTEFQLNTSVWNPFSCSPGSQFIGLIILHVPVIAIMVSGLVVLDLQYLANQEFVAAVENRDVERILGQSFEHGKAFLLFILFSLCVAVFAGVYGVFLFHLGGLMALVNDEDIVTRLMVMWIPLVVYAIVFFLTGIIYPLFGLF